MQTDPDQAAARRFVTDVLKMTGWTPSELARRANVSHTTLTRFLNNGSVTHTLSDRTLGKIRRAALTAVPREQLDGLWLLAQRSAAP